MGEANIEMEICNGFSKKANKGNDVSLQELNAKLVEFARVRDWEKYHTPRNLLLALKTSREQGIRAFTVEVEMIFDKLVGEVGELSEIFQWKGEVARGLPNWSPRENEHLEEEISDVLLYLVQLAHVCGLDLGQAALTKIHKNSLKYPPSVNGAGHQSA